MRRITITPEIEALADQFKVQMLYKSPDDHDGAVSKVCANLKYLREKLDSGDIVPMVGDVDYDSYIKRIEDNYLTLLTMHPNKFNEEFGVFNHIVEENHLSEFFEIKKVDRQGNVLGKSYKKKFYELIVWAMRYDYVQGTVFPDYIRELGIRTCVYCNSQYAITTRGNNSFYQLDHCFPKSKYPFLATNFFNLQPSCGSCNQRKSNEDMQKGKYNVSIWKEPDDKQESYFDFHIEDGSLAAYMTEPKRDKLDIQVIPTKKGDADLNELLDLLEQKFKTTEVYREHREEVEEVIWKKYIYTNTYVDSLQKAFNTKFLDRKGELKRLLLGTYTDTKDVYKRPLTKMIQDVAKQLKIDTLIGK